MKISAPDLKKSAKIALVATFMFLGAASATAAIYGTWSDPTAAPTGNNAAAPISVLGDQTKQGGLILNTPKSDNTTAATGLYVVNGLSIFGGNVGVGTSNPGANLEVNNILKLTNTSSDPNDGKIGTATFAAGLNIVGINTDGGGRKINEWGSIIQNQNDSFNKFTGYTRIADLNGSSNYGQIIDTPNLHLDSFGGDIYLNYFTSRPVRVMGSLCFADGSCQSTASSGSASRLTWSDSLARISIDGGGNNASVNYADNVGTIKSHISVSSTSGTAVIAYCPVGYSVIGGGIDVSSNTNAIIRSYPRTDLNGWDCQVTFGNTANCYVICVN